MKVHNISIDKKYFEPIRNGQITLLIFKHKIIDDGNPGDYIVASQGNYDIKSRLKRTYIKAFMDITDEEAQQAGFLNKDFLEEELVKKYDLKPSFNLFSEIGMETIDKEFFFLVAIDTDEQSFFSQNGFKNVNLYSKEFNKEFYTIEDKDRIWRNYDDKKI